jgi:cell volume regulation protein A
VVTFNAVFFVVLTSVLLQGTTLLPVARLLRVNTPLKVRPVYPFELVTGTELKNELWDITVPADSRLLHRQLVNLGLPDGSLIVLIMRQGEVIVPGGTTQIKAGDTLLILSDRGARQAIEARLRETEPEHV